MSWRKQNKVKINNRKFDENVITFISQFFHFQEKSLYYKTADFKLSSVLLTNFVSCVYMAWLSKMFA